VIYASAPGKLNLFFEVGPLRPDGYHSVISIYQALAIRQRVGVEPHSKWEVITEGDLPQQQLDLVPKDEKNLCVIAAKALAAYAGIANPQPMRFLTHKQVPVAAGLAGGSADAAASLIALNKAWKLGLTSGQLQQVASKVMFPQGDITVEPQGSIEVVRAGSNLGKNSLLSPALSLRPELADYQSLIGGTTGHLSGSGPTIYFVTKDANEASDWANQLRTLGHLVIQTTTSNHGATLE